MGAPSFDMQQMQVQKAYQQNVPALERKIESKPKAFVSEVKENCKDLMAEIKVDGVDTAYIWARTFIPSWLMGVMLLIGAFVVLKQTLSKFGINIQIMSINKKS